MTLQKVMNQSRGKKGRGDNNGDEFDHASTRLCDLPDEVLHKIMVLLPINEAIRTCILARRWEHLWRSMPCLIFKENSRITNFYQFADRVCTLRDHSTAQELVIEYCQDHRDHDRLNALIMVAIKDQVKELCMDLSDKCPPSYVLPYDIFRLETLVRFELYAYTLKLPDSISLPRLKGLHLKFVETEDGKSIQKLISSCPILEELTLSYCCWGKYRTRCVTFSVPNLQRLFVKTQEYPSLLPDLLIHCENLKELKYVGAVDHEIMVSGGHSNQLEQAILGFSRLTDPNSAVTLLNSLSSTRRLTLSGYSAEILGESSRIPRLRQFDNMVELCIYGLKSLNITAQTLLRNSPSLQMLTLQGCWHHTPLRLYDLLDSAHLCHMKKITLAPHHGHIDLRFVGMLLRRCQFLEELVLRIRRSGVDDGVLGMVRSLEKVSEDCRISTEYF